MLRLQGFGLRCNGAKPRRISPARLRSPPAIKDEWINLGGTGIAVWTAPATIIRFSLRLSVAAVGAEDSIRRASAA